MFLNPLAGDVLLLPGNPRQESEVLITKISPAHLHTWLRRPRHLSSACRKLPFSFFPSRALTGPHSGPSFFWPHVSTASCSPRPVTQPLISTLQSGDPLKKA